MSIGWNAELKKLDPSGAEKAIDFVHSMVHEGRSFEVSWKTPSGSPIANNASIAVLLNTGRRPPHVVFDCECGGESEVEFFEGTAVSGVGTVLSAHNMNRASGMMTPSTTASINPTVTGAGVLIFNAMIPGGAGGPTRSGGTFRVGTEWILKPDYRYLIRLTNRAGNAQQASIAVEWYELS